MMIPNNFSNIQIQIVIPAGKTCNINGKNFYSENGIFRIPLSDILNVFTNSFLECNSELDCVISKMQKIRLFTLIADTNIRTFGVSNIQAYLECDRETIKEVMRILQRYDILKKYYSQYRFNAAEFDLVIKTYLDSLEKEDNLNGNEDVEKIASTGDVSSLLPSKNSIGNGKKKIKKIKRVKKNGLPLGNIR